MNRREFFRKSGAGALAGRWGETLSRDSVPAEAEKGADSEKLKRIGICTWSLHAYFASTRPKDSKWPGSLIELREFPELAADRYHVHNLELVNTHFESTQPSYLADLKRALAKARSRVTDIPVDCPSDWHGKGLSDPDDTPWQAEITERKKWIDVAAELGATSIRPNPGGTAQMTDLSRPIAAYKQLGAYGKSRGVKVLIENHGNVAGKATNIVAIIQGAGPDWVGALPDFGNFPPEERYYGLQLLFPFAPTVYHARGSEFNAQGEETGFDFRRCIRIAEAAGFQGIYSAEFAGPGEPYQATQRIIDELVRFL